MKKFGAKEVAVADEIFADEFVRHDLHPGNPLSGPAGQKMIASDFRAAFPDLQIAVDVMVAEGDWVVAR